MLTVDDLKKHLNIDHDEDDAYIIFGPETRGLPEDYILDNFNKEQENSKEEEDK